MIAPVPVDVAAAHTGVWLLSAMTRITGPRTAPTLTPAGARLSRIDPATGRELGRIDVGSTPEGLTQGWTGRLWVRGLPLAVADPRTGSVHVNRDLRCVALVADARPGVWAYSPCSDALVRLTPEAGPTGATVRLRGARPAAMALGGDGLYLARPAGGAAVVERRDPHTGRLLRRARVGAPPDGLVLRGGSVWALGGGTGTLDRLDPVTLRRTARIPVPRAPGAARLAVGGGAAWVTDPDVPAVVRIDPRTERPRPRMLAGLPAATIPVAIATGPRAVWLVARSDGTRGALCRLAPRDGRVERCFPRSR